MTDCVMPATGKLIGNKFYYPIRVYFEDTDIEGIVYFANYLKFAERARTEFVRYLGFRQQDNFENGEKKGFVVKHMEIDYKSPATLDDCLTVTVQISKMKNVSIELIQEIKRQEETLAVVTIKVGYMDFNSGSLCKLSPQMLEKFALASCC